MSAIFRFRQYQPITWFHKSRAKSNQHCLYCGGYVGEGSELVSDREHLIGRNFVPEGAFLGGQEFNFIIRCCRDCNAQKAEYERHVSSCTLVTSASRGSDPLLDAQAIHKAGRDFHPDKRGVLVKDAGDNHEFRFASPGIAMTFSAYSPPQLNREYVAQLASYQVQGLFSLLTSSNPLVAEETRLLPLDHFKYFGYFNHQDWGNPQFLEIIRRTADWRCCANITTARGYFRAIMKRDDVDNAGWFWALEWNRSVRVCGAIVRPKEEPTLFADLPERAWMITRADEHVIERICWEVPLAEANDMLFTARVNGS